MRTNNTVVTGRVHSIQSMGTLDGPGVRFVVFTQGCPLRCKCCHNPDTWDFSGGKEYTTEQLVKQALRFREYFGKDGGVTASGGEPLMQAEFVSDFFERCQSEGLNTCLDTSGCVLNEEVKRLLCHTDRVLLDIKFTTSDAYRENTGGDMSAVMDFLSYLDEQGIPTTLRQVIIPTVNDTEEQVKELKRIADSHKNVDKIELLPFRKICQVKYDDLGIDFPYGSIPEPSREKMKLLEDVIK